MPTYFCPKCGSYKFSAEDKRLHEKRTGHKLQRSRANPIAALRVGGSLGAKTTDAIVGKKFVKRARS